MSVTLWWANYVMVIFYKCGFISWSGVATSWRLVITVKLPGNQWRLGGTGWYQSSDPTLGKNVNKHIFSILHAIVPVQQDNIIKAMFSPS